MRRSGRPLLLVTLLWALFGWLHGTQLFIGIRTETASDRYSYGRLVLWEVACWLLWAAFTPLVVWICRRVPLAPRPRPVLLHLLASGTLPLVRILGVYLVTEAIQPFGPAPQRSFAANYVGMLSSYFHLDILVYWAIVGVVHAVESRRRLRERELHASRVEAQLANARLANLRLQLQPHFLFNTLHAIAALVRDGDQRSAVTMIAGLSDLLRYSLDNAGRNFVPLAEEIEVVRKYLEIQQARFPDRLQVTIDLAEQTRDAAVPTLLLQPLIENAIRHGIAASAGGGRLEIHTRREEKTLVIEVFDDGAGLPPDWQEREGVGLTSTRGRLEQLYGSNGRLELADRPPAGVVARVRLPFSRELPDV